MKLGHWLRLFQAKKKGTVLSTGQGLDALNIEAIAIDSRAVLPGGVFVAIKGTKMNGHDFIQDAIQKKAVAIITEEPVDEYIQARAEGVYFIQVDDSKAALAHLVPAFYEHPADDLHLIGITGTNGKTTTCYLIDQILCANAVNSARLTTITYRIGNQEVKASHTTPGLLDLHKLFYQMQKAGLSHVAMEVSSHALDQGRVAGCNFEAMVFTNLTEEHLDYHQSMEAYYQSKKRLCNLTTGRCIINRDDPWGKRLLAEVAQPTWSYGMEDLNLEGLSLDDQSLKARADIYPEQYTSDLNGILMSVKSPIGVIDITSPLIGRYNASNLLAAIGLGIALGFSGEKIAAGLADMQGVPGRFEKINAGQPFTVIVDYAHTADALFRLLQSLAELGSKRIITLFGCGGDRDRSKRPKMAAAASAFSQKIILTSDNPRSEAPLAIIREIESGFYSDEAGADEESPDGQCVDYEMISDRKEAIERAIQVAEAGDIVVIAGKGHETDQQIGQQRFPFDDRKLARAALEKRFGNEA